VVSEPSNNKRNKPHTRRNKRGMLPPPASLSPLCTSVVKLCDSRYYFTPIPLQETPSPPHIRGGGGGMKTAAAADSCSWLLLIPPPPPPHTHTHHQQQQEEQEHSPEAQRDHRMEFRDHDHDHGPASQSFLPGTGTGTAVISCLASRKRKSCTQGEWSGVKRRETPPLPPPCLPHLHSNLRVVS
jgi:hypothetical protein